jgi:hypothetical protein
MQTYRPSVDALQHRSQEYNLFFSLTLALVGKTNFSQLILFVAWREQDYGTGAAMGQLRFWAGKSYF